ncbi:hypothetical protein [Dyadobacter linearis]|uniref:hypothetical protein n=1 Tax=Dyadobacter linearis TaxID=2823330 RepID=UPI001BFC6D71|nr:hypothetical protein [Dyadobacter sp. CECT 9623]
MEVGPGWTNRRANTRGKMREAAAPVADPGIGKLFPNLLSSKCVGALLTLA